MAKQTATKEQPSAADAEVKRLLSAQEATDKGLVPVDHVWDQQSQTAVPRGLALEAAMLERPVDLEAQLAWWKKQRDILLNFVKTYLEEASYDSRGYPIQGKLRDYYVVPGAKQKALTKRGAEKLAGLFRFAKGETKLVGGTETADFVSQTVEVTLRDQYRRQVGSAVSSCSSAEAGFRSIYAQKKYGATIEDNRITVKPDWRAALNDIIARAGKRAFVQAVIYAVAGDEIFTTAEEADPGEQAAPPSERRPPKQEQENRELGPFLPKAKALKEWSGRSVRQIPPDKLQLMITLLGTKTKRPEVWQPVVEALKAEMERRNTQILESEDDDLPF
jgi:hypothetical protein